MPHTLESSARVSVQCATHTHTRPKGKEAYKGAAGRGSHLAGTVSDRLGRLRPSGVCSQTEGFLALV